MLRNPVITLTSDNGSVPPPHRRSTELSIESDGRARMEARRGYDLTDADQRHAIEFQLTADQQRRLSLQCDISGVFSTTWQEVERPNIGGSSMLLSIRDGQRSVRIPGQLIEPQRYALDQLVAMIRALVPESALQTLAQWRG